MMSWACRSSSSPERARGRSSGGAPGRAIPQRAARLRLAELLDLARRLEDTFGEDGAAETWLRTDSCYLGGMKPSEAIRVGRVDRVEAALEALDSGNFLQLSIVADEPY